MPGHPVYGKIENQQKFKEKRRQTIRKAEEIQSKTSWKNITGNLAALTGTELRRNEGRLDTVCLCPLCAPVSCRRKLICLSIYSASLRSTMRRQLPQRGLTVGFKWSGGGEGAAALGGGEGAGCGVQRLNLEEQYRLKEPNNKRKGECWWGNRTENRRNPGPGLGTAVQSVPLRHAAATQCGGRPGFHASRLWCLSFSLLSRWRVFQQLGLRLGRAVTKMRFVLRTDGDSASCLWGIFRGCCGAFRCSQMGRGSSADAGKWAAGEAEVTGAELRSEGVNKSEQKQR